ncbi:MAG: glycosyltransferase [Opitutae bacterium]|nr:glycosyltransferase [Opitutae bacterium]MBT5379162.1 glycosyltransferase [Opitutae bacterium]
MTCHLSLVIPHYNEEDRLNLMEEGLVEFVKEIKNLKVEAILVDDGSHDKTLSGLKRIGKDFSRRHNVAPENFNLRIVALKKNSGKGAALQRGVAEAHGSLILTLDADMATRPIEILNWQKDGYVNLKSEPKNQVFIGSREHKNSNVTDKSSRRIMGRVFNRITRILSGLPFHDTQCGFKLYTASLAKEVFSKLFHLGWAHDVEILMRLQQEDVEIHSLPINWTAIDGSKINPISDAWKMFCALIEIRAALKKENAQ